MHIKPEVGGKKRPYLHVRTSAGVHLLVPVRAHLMLSLGAPLCNRCAQHVQPLQPGSTDVFTYRLHHAGNRPEVLLPPLATINGDSAVRLTNVAESREKGWEGGVGVVVMKDGE